MAAEKSEALVLKTIPFRETSLILHLFTKEHGLVHAIAKGVRTGKKGQVTVERGQLIELNLYIKPDRDLQTCGAITTADFFAAVRDDLLKSTVRDCAFETILSVIKESDEHPELFNFFSKFISFINRAEPIECYPAALLLFYYRFIEHMGVAFDLENCISCGCLLTGVPVLDIANGGLECESCRKVSSGHQIPIEVLSFLKSGKPSPKEISKIISKIQSEKITSTLSDFIRYHFEIKHPFKTLDFLFTIT